MGGAFPGFGASSVEEKFSEENFRVNREMRDEILVYESILSNFWAKF